MGRSTKDYTWTPATERPFTRRADAIDAAGELTEAGFKTKVVRTPAGRWSVRVREPRLTVRGGGR